jgi:carboxymethylenebutenolidase
LAQVEFQRPDGAACPAYLAEPAGGKSNGRAVVIAYEMWGIAPSICGLGDNLFRGRQAHDLSTGFALMGGLDYVDATTQDMAGGALWLKTTGSKVAVLGVCMGGAIALLTAASAKTVDAAVCFYGIPPLEAFDPAQIRVPLSCHFAARDTWCTPERVDALEERLRAGQVPYELFRYDSDHAFMNPDGPGYDPASERLAWPRVLSFLERTLS